MRVAEQLADDQAAARAQHPRDLAQRRLLVGDLAEHRGQHHRVDRAGRRTGARWRRPGSRPRLSSPRSAARAHRVVEHLLLQVEDLQRARRRRATRRGRASSSRCRPDLEHRSPGAGRSTSRSRSRVISGCGASTQKRWPYGQAEGFLRHHSAAPRAAAGARQARAPARRTSAREADRVRVVVDADEDDGREVERHRALLGLQVVPAACRPRPPCAARRARRRRASPRAPGRCRSRSQPGLVFRHLLLSVLPLVRRSRSVPSRSPSGAEGDPAVADPGARLGVDQLDALALELGERRLDVVDAVGDVVQARALALEELADRGVRAERREQLDVAARRRRAGPPRRPARRRSRGGRAASRRCPRRARARRRGPSTATPT